jgi:uncharacterized RDD family membrane protein YckC
MKISDLKNYEVQKDEPKKFRLLAKRKKTVSSAKVIMQSFIDFSLCTILRIVFGVLLFKYFIRNTPIEQIQTITTSQQMAEFLRDNHIVKHGITAFCTVFILGALYYILLIARTEKGTVGSWAMDLRFRLPNGSRPSIMQVSLWYTVKSLYPIFGILFLIVFFMQGVGVAAFILFILTAVFSNVPSMMLGTRTLAEIISSVTIVKYTK